MEIAIPDDCRNVVHELRCYGALGKHEVVHYREKAADLSDFARRLHAAAAIMAANPPLLAMPTVVCTHHIAWAEHDTCAVCIDQAFESSLASARGESCNGVDAGVLARPG